MSCSRSFDVVGTKDAKIEIDRSHVFLPFFFPLQVSVLMATMAFCVPLISLAVETYIDQMYCARRSIDTCPCCAQRCLSKRQPMTRQQIDCRSSFRPDSRQPTLTYIARFIIASDCANRCPTGRHMKEKKLNRRRPDYVGPNLLL